jgi:hypothetical protein
MKIRPVSFAAQMSVLVDWTDRSALVVSRIPQPDLLAALREASLTAAVTDPASCWDTGSQLRDFAILSVDSSALDSDEAVIEIARLRARSPQARTLLLSRPEALDASGWARAVSIGFDAVVDPRDDLATRRLIHNWTTGADSGEQRVLAIGAHPDDVEIGCAGALLNHSRSGDRVTILTLTCGDRDRGHPRDRRGGAAAPPTAC